MSNVYISINGDNVGERIGNAIAQDNHEELMAASSSIQGAHDSVDQWVDSIGGKKISAAGDDAIYMIPEQSVDDLDGIREQYKQQSGHGLTIGVGASMSQASKALIYGKLNGKDQTIHYEPMIEDYLSEEGEEQPEIPNNDELQDQADSDMETDAGSEDLENTADIDENVDDSESAVPGAEGSGQPEDLMDEEMPEVGLEDNTSEDDEMAAEDSVDSGIDGKTDVDFGTSEKDQDEDSSDNFQDGDVSNESDMPDTDVETDEAANMADSQDSDLENEEEPLLDEDQADGDADMTEDQELSDEDVVDPLEEDDGEDPLASMIHGDMQEGGTEEQLDDGSGMDANQDDGDAALDEELKNDIAQSLLAFKENKHMLEDARETNPALYDATLTMLRSMISMAKKLGFAPEQDMADQEANSGLEEGFPEAGAEDMSEEPTEDMPNEGEDETIEDAGEEAPSDKKGPLAAKK